MLIEVLVSKLRSAFRFDTGIYILFLNNKTSSQYADKKEVILRNLNKNNEYKQ